MHNSSIIHRPPPTTDDVNITVLTSYNAEGKVSEIIAVNPLTGNQTTRFIYGTTLADSDIARSDLLRAEVYPDSVDEDDRITHQYNRQGERTQTTDQNGTVHVFDFDALGREIHDRVTTLGSGVDGAVRRISTEFEVRGMREKITSYNGETVGSGSIVNEVLFEYNDFGQLTEDYQAHGGAVNTSTTPKVQYGYANGTDNTIRPTTITYPNGRVITFDFGTSGGNDDAASRVAAIVDDDTGSTHLADYSYLGEQAFVVVDYTEPDIKWTLLGTAGGTDPDTGDIYRGFDRFGRIKDNYWYNYGSSTDVDRLKYGYDRNGNRTYRENTVAASLGKYFDELYSYDLIDRLATMDRGELNSLKTAVSNLQFAQDWALDATGNWSGLKEDDDGSGAWDLNQQRTANKVNEITDLSETAGPSWITPEYNKAGNMTTIPQPADPTRSYGGTYDAWNRMVKIRDGGSTLAECQYDGAKRRSVLKSYDAGVLAETRHFFYSRPQSWMILEERVGASPAAQSHRIIGLRFRDDSVLRDRDLSGNGTFDERLYIAQDELASLDAVCSANGTVEERYCYDAYGSHTFLTPEFVIKPATDFDLTTLYAGYTWDSISGIHHVRNRHWTPMIGWLQRDPAGYIDGYNLYEYSHSSPINFSDPLGLACGCLDFATGNGTFCDCALSNEMSCWCWAIGWLDVLAGFIPPFHPVVRFIQVALNALDCYCNIVGTIAHFCNCKNADPWTVVGGVVAELGSCLLDMIQISNLLKPGGASHRNR